MTKNEHTGWICPRCEVALAPWMGRCECKPMTKEVPREEPPPVAKPLMEVVPWDEPIPAPAVPSPHWVMQSPADFSAPGRGYRVEGDYLVSDCTGSGGSLNRWRIDLDDVLRLAIQIFEFLDGAAFLTNMRGLRGRGEIVARGRVARFLDSIGCLERRRHGYKHTREGAQAARRHLVSTLDDMAMDNLIDQIGGAR